MQNFHINACQSTATSEEKISNQIEKMSHSMEVSYPLFSDISSWDASHTKAKSMEREWERERNLRYGFMLALLPQGLQRTWYAQLINRRCLNNECIILGTPLLPKEVQTWVLIRGLTDSTKLIIHIVILTEHYNKLLGVQLWFQFGNSILKL